MKVVLDTNVLINAERGVHSYAARILQAVLDAELDAYASPKMKKEHRLIRGRLVKDPEMHALIDDYLDVVQEVFPTQYLDVVPTDRDDNKFIETALAAGASHIITNDHDLLDLGSYENIQIVTPENFWHIFEKEKDPDGSQGWSSWFSGIMGS